jgi:predicted MFS family arabinose efflux permease
MVAMGVGEVAGGFIHGLIIDRIGSKNTVFINVAIVVIMTITAFSNVVILEYGFPSVLMCFTWGYNDGSLNTFLYQILGFEFKNHSEVFGAWNFWQGISIFFFELI